MDNARFTLSKQVGARKRKQIIPELPGRGSEEAYKLAYVSCDPILLQSRNFARQLCQVSLASFEKLAHANGCHVICAALSLLLVC